MTMRARSLAVVATAVLAGTALTGCSVIGQLTGEPDIDFTTVQLHPTGDPGSWIDPAYDAGVATSWSTAGDACGAADGVIAISEGGSIVGHDWMTGAEVWRVENAACSDQQVAAGDIYAVRLTADGSQYFQVDIATGQVQVFYEAPIVVTSSTTVGRGESAVYIHANADVGPALLAFAFDGTILWQQPMETMMHTCYLLGDHIVCSSFMDGVFSVLDATTGEATIPETPIESNKTLLLSTGGYTFVSSGITMDVETTTVYDFEGNEIGTADDARLPGELLLGDRTFYTVEDLMSEAARYVSVTDADGHVVAHGVGAHDVLTATGTELGEDDIPQAAAADGSTLIVQSYTTDQTRLLAPDGTVLQELDGSWVRVYGGAITVMSFDTAETVIYVPAG